MLLRNVLLSLSRSQGLQDLIVALPVARRVSRRFVAGETLDEAIAAVQRVNALGLMATLNYLGESVTSESDAIAGRDAYLEALEAIVSAGLDSHISIKLTQLGLDLGEDFCYENVERIVAYAAERGRFVRIDMEDSSYTQRTLDLYRRLRRSYDNVGVVIQAYLYRSRADVEALIEEGIAHIRLCKGAYAEPPSIAYPARRDVDENLLRLVWMMLAPEARERGAYPAIATHDERIISRVRAYVYHHRVPVDAYEFQMLYGVRRDAQQRLADEGYRMRVYIPYGTHWYPYFMRRLAERPANLLFFLRALLER